VTRRAEIVALAGVGEIAEGADLAALIVEACAASGWTLADGDVVCVAQKAVSKAEGATVALGPDEDVEAARRRIARDEAVRVVADTDHVLIVETRHGFVCANAGVDASNVGDGRLALLPDDPDRSARAIAAGLSRAVGVDVGVIVTDTFGRPWRMGQTDVAIGVAGFTPLRDERGDTDRQGRALDVTVAAIADEIAGAADLARRKADGTPFVVVRGLEVEPDEAATARMLVRPAEEDLFRRAAPEDAV
jgi:coenzyme F420-0:L-glutamate ligase / coenzyme F420-1:gamma-L-glutamate ligase